MKRVLFFLIAGVFATSLFAQSADSGTVLSPDGTVYTVETKANDDFARIPSTTYLLLSIQTGDQVSRVAVPGSITGGNNWQAELAYDADSETLFAFWIHSDNSVLATNTLLFSSYHAGRWTSAVAIDDSPYHIRHNLRLGVTRVIETIDPETGKVEVVPSLTVHTVWWDESGNSEVARYAMVTVANDGAPEVVRRDLPDFINTAYLRNFDASAVSTTMLRKPVVIESQAHDTVDIVFGDVQSNMMHRLTLKPVLNSRVRIPIGVREVNYPTPKFQIGSDSARLSTMATSSDRLIFYTTTKSYLEYMTFEHGKWSGVRTIALNETVTPDTALTALRRLVSGD